MRGSTMILECRTFSLMSWAFPSPISISASARVGMECRPVRCCRGSRKSLWPKNPIG